MSIKNPLPGHKYGESVPGYWYPREVSRKRYRWDKRTSRQALGWLIALLVILVGVDAAHAHRKSPVTAPGVYQPAPVAAAPALSQSPSSTVPATVPPTTLPTPSGYAGARPGDERASANGSATVNGVQVTAANWVKMTIDGGQPAVCFTAAIVNGTGSQVSYGFQDWALQSPSGDVHMPTMIMYALGTPSGQPPDLSFGELIPGGRTSGRICFDNPEQTGTYVASFHPETSSGGRAVWLVTMK